MKPGKAKESRMTEAQKPRAVTLGPILIALMLSGCAQEVSAPTAYSLQQCRRVELRDSEIGESVRGAEDLAFDAKSGQLFVSAYDRRETERAVQKNAQSIPEGGVYSIDLAALLSVGSEPVNVRSLIRRGDVEGGLRPHGLFYEGRTGEIIFINRGYRRIKGQWGINPRMERIGANGGAFLGESVEANCAANDVLSLNENVLMTFDHGACDWRAGLEDVFSLKRSGVAAVGVGAIFDHALFANGIVQTLGGDIIVAATREKALLKMVEVEGDLTLVERVLLPGGPDNLTLSFDGSVIAAVHPSMLRIGFQRKFGLGRAPSRIVKIDPDQNDITILFDDLHGEYFSAATVAIETREALILGSVIEDGLLVCEKSE